MARQVTLRFVPTTSPEPGAHICTMLYEPVDVTLTPNESGRARCPYCGRRLDLRPPNTVIERISRPSLL